MDHRMIFVNLPVEDLTRSREFFAGLGYEFDERMSNGAALGMRTGANHYVMLLGHEFFAEFHPGELAQQGHHEVLVCVSAESRAQVDDLVDRAVAAGGTAVRTEEQGEFMYGRSYSDLDGHIWEVMWMDVEGATRAGVFG